MIVVHKYLVDGTFQVTLQPSKLPEFVAVPLAATDTANP